MSSLLKNLFILGFLLLGQSQIGWAVDEPRLQADIIDGGDPDKALQIAKERAQGLPIDIVEVDQTVGQAWASHYESGLPEADLRAALLDISSGHHFQDEEEVPLPGVLKRPGVKTQEPWEPTKKQLLLFRFITSGTAGFICIIVKGLPFVQALEHIGLEGSLNMGILAIGPSLLSWSYAILPWRALLPPPSKESGKPVEGKEMTWLEFWARLPVSVVNRSLVTLLVILTIKDWDYYFHDTLVEFTLRDLWKVGITVSAQAIPSMVALLKSGRVTIKGRAKVVSDKDRSITKTMALYGAAFATLVSATAADLIPTKHFGKVVAWLGGMGLMWSFKNFDGTNPDRLGYRELAGLGLQRGGTLCVDSFLYPVRTYQRFRRKGEVFNSETFRIEDEP